MRLIDADALDTAPWEEPGDAVKAIRNAPTIDAVPVVRCKDCRYRDPENHHCDHAGGALIYFPRKPDDFCSYGERKGGSE